MARFDLGGTEQMMKDFRRLGQQGEAAAIAIVQAAAEEVVSQWQASAELHGHVDTGSMINGIKATDAASDGDGIASEVYPRGKDKRGTRNAMKAFILNYGTSRIPPSHWVEHANQDAAPVVTGMMTSMWATFLETGNVPAGQTGAKSAKKRGRK